MHRGHGIGIVSPLTAAPTDVQRKIIEATLRDCYEPGATAHVSLGVDLWTLMVLKRFGYVVVAHNNDNAVVEACAFLVVMMSPEDRTPWTAWEFARCLGTARLSITNRGVDYKPHTCIARPHGAA